MMQYALIKNGAVQNVIVADDAFVSLIGRDWDHIEALDTLHEQGLGVGIGWQWDGVAFSPPAGEVVPPTDLPEINIVAVSAEGGGQFDVDALFTDCTVPAGTTLLITAELRHGGVIVPVDQVFRMPVLSTDNRERVVIASMVQGRITMRIPFTESRIWRVTQEAVNRSLPSEQHMAFRGITVYVVEAQ